MTAHRLTRRLSISVATLLISMLVGVAATPQTSSAQTLCVLDFNRLGDDAGLDWLEEGLADMMIRTMNRVSLFQVIEREHLKDILREHGLAENGLVDGDTAIRLARLAKAQLLLQGSFSGGAGQLTIQIRLIRISDQRILAQSVWTGGYREILSTPLTLSESLLSSLKAPIDPGQLEGIEKEIPTTIDAAKAYYEGLQSFENGHYPEALALYLEAARQAADFSKAHSAVLEMYYLLGKSEHAVLFSRQLAGWYEKRGDLPNALKYYFLAARHCVDPLGEHGSAIRLLQRLLRLVEQSEQRIGEIEETKQVILDRIDELHQTGRYDSFGKIVADRSIRYRLWPGDIEGELRRRAEEQARGGYTLWQDKKWVKRPVPEPSVLMWKIRAQRMLSRAYARMGLIERALDHYRELVEEYAFLTRHPLYEGRHSESIRTEAHFMLLRHYASTGRLVRDHALRDLNRLNMVRDGLLFTRNFKDRSPDARARVASRYEDRGYEYFDFASPPGYQIDAVTLRAEVEGIAAFSFNLPHPAGWPPQFSFSKRFEHLKFRKPGTHEQRVSVPGGTEFLSIGTSWGPGLYSNTAAEIISRLFFGPGDDPDIVRWEASFSLSPKAAANDTATSPPSALRKLVGRYAGGWEGTSLLAGKSNSVYTGSPSLDVYAKDWLCYAMDGDIQILQRRRLQRRIGLPITINTREREFEPSLVRSHDGRYALLWARGTSKRNAKRFVSFSADLVQWQTPQRLIFDRPAADSGYTYGQLEPLERTYNVVPTGQGYVMLLPQGFIRHSENLRFWGPPQKMLRQDLYRNRLLKTRDGTLWAIYANSSEDLQPYTSQDRLHGYFVVNGRRYRHITELCVSRSSDGRTWQEVGKITLPGQPSGLWGFAVSDRAIGIAMGFNNLFVNWFTTSPSGRLRRIESPLQVMHQSEQAHFFVDETSLTCIRPIFDPGEQQSRLLLTHSRALYEKYLE